MQTNGKKCNAFRAFNHWQLNRLWPAIEEDRHYMGENLYREVSFKEAETDFFAHNGYGCLAQWRAEFCHDLCPNRATCALACDFIAQAKAA